MHILHTSHARRVLKKKKKNLHSAWGLSWWLSGWRILLPMQDTQVQSLGWEDLEKEMATYSNIVAWTIPWTEEPAKLQPMGSQRVRHDLVTQQQQSAWTNGAEISSSTVYSLKDSCKLRINSVTYIFPYYIMQSLKYFYTLPTNENTTLSSVRRFICKL